MIREAWAGVSHFGEMEGTVIDERQRVVGRELRRMREERCLALTEAAQLMGIPASNLCNAEQGKLHVSGGMAWRLARLYGAEVLALVPPGLLFPQVPLAGRRAGGFDVEALSAFVLPGGVRVLVPAAMARALT